MKEFVLVEFLVEFDNFAIMTEKLTHLKDDFVPIKFENEEESDEDGNYQEYTRISGKISSICASVIKLADPFLAERMRISYIPEDLKDKYRR